ncbi:phBC6A51 family helix-turn-helix protein [Bacillus thuringiensis]|uniref:phBC6A51 family helix-turn-helix protein n=1 Tax=Bacillus thuringiensis TaxID=1428 RepID=UPI00345B39FE
MALTETQKTCIDLMIAEPQRTQQSIAEEIGVHYNTISKWKKNAEFNDYFKEISIQVHKSFLHETLTVLRKKALDEKTRSHVKYLELSLKTYGLLTDRVESEVTVKEEKSDKDLLAELDSM